MLNPQLLEKLKEIIYPVAELYEVESEYWINGDDESESFCYDCAIKRIAEIEHFEENGFDYTNLSDCYSLTQILNSFEGTDSEDLLNDLAVSIVTKFETAIWQRKSDPLGLMPLMMIGTLVLLSPLMLITLLIASAIIPFKYLATFLSDKIFIMLTVTRD